MQLVKDDLLARIGASLHSADPMLVTTHSPMPSALLLTSLVSRASRHRRLCFNSGVVQVVMTAGNVKIHTATAAAVHTTGRLYRFQFSVTGLEYASCLWVLLVENGRAFFQQ